MMRRDLIRIEYHVDGRYIVPVWRDVASDPVRSVEVRTPIHLDLEWADLVADDPTAAMAAELILDTLARLEPHVRRMVLALEGRSQARSAEEGA